MVSRTRARHRYGAQSLVDGSGLRRYGLPSRSNISGKSNVPDRSRFDVQLESCASSASTRRATSACHAVYSGGTSRQSPGSPVPRSFAVPTGCGAAAGAVTCASCGGRSPRVSERSPARIAAPSVPCPTPSRADRGSGLSVRQPARTRLAAAPTTLPRRPPLMLEVYPNPDPPPPTRRKPAPHGSDSIGGPEDTLAMCGSSGSSTAPLATARASAVALPRISRTTLRFRKSPFRTGSRM